MALAIGTSDRDDGTLRGCGSLDPPRVFRYSGYSVFTPPRAASAGTHGSFFSHSVSAVFWPGRKCGTWWRSVPPFSANAVPLQVSIATFDVRSIVYVVDSTYGSSM